MSTKKIAKFPALLAPTPFLHTLSRRAMLRAKRTRQSRPSSCSRANRPVRQTTMRKVSVRAKPAASIGGEDSPMLPA